MKNLASLAESLEYMISEDCCETQFDFRDEVREAVSIIRLHIPSVMTIDEIRSRTDQFACWMQWKDGSLFLAVVRPRGDMIDYVGINNAFVFFPEQYGKEVVIWTGKPTEEQRRAVKWDA